MSSDQLVDPIWSINNTGRIADLPRGVNWGKPSEVITEVQKDLSSLQRERRSRKNSVHCMLKQMRQWWKYYV